MGSRQLPWYHSFPIPAATSISSCMCPNKCLIQNFLPVPLGGDIIEVVSPTKPGTTAGRLLSKRGDGGYMIIMQTSDANAQRKRIESRGLGKVIYSHEHDGAVCVQYHPKGVKGTTSFYYFVCFRVCVMVAGNIVGALRTADVVWWDKGGMMPELDSHTPTPQNPDPLTSRFSPWHACGPDYEAYSAGMKRAFHLHLIGVTLRLAPHDTDIEAAAKQ